MKTGLVIVTALLLGACGVRGTRADPPPSDPVVTTVTEAPPTGEPTSTTSADSSTASTVSGDAETSAPPLDLDIDELDRVLDELDRTMTELSQAFTTNEGDITP